MISIIIPVLNLHESTAECLKAIEKYTSDYEIIIVDNGSNPPFSLHLDKGCGKVIRNEKNLGFPAAVNQGIEEAVGEYICLLNNDVFITPQWADRMTAHLIGGLDIVAPMSGYGAGFQKVLLPIYNDALELEERAGEYSRLNGGKYQEVNWVIGFCFMFRKRLSDEIGRFDDSMWPCSGEEIDFCLRARQRGYRVGIAKDVYVHHEGSRTFKNTHTANEYNALTLKTLEHLYKKWGQFIALQDKVSVPMDLNSNQKVRLNLGCGFKKLEGYTNIDLREECNPDLQTDISKGLPFDDNSVDEIKAMDFLEHIPIGAVIPTLEEIFRVLKPGGRLEHLTPSTDGRGAFQDPNHQSFWNENSWLYFMNDEHRNLYGIRAKFKGENKTLCTNPGLKIYHVHGMLYADK
jgi:GT2 family glycosyltransferase/predicted SAM-dependent methyltransferase